MTLEFRCEVQAREIHVRVMKAQGVLTAMRLDETTMQFVWTLKRSALRMET